MLKIAIVEDETAASDALALCIKRYCGQYNLTYNVVLFKDAVSLLNGYQPVYDIIFMDIMLPNLNGMEASKRLRKLDSSVLLMFVTNMANFAVKGYEVDALDFIIKPVVYNSFAMKMNKAVNNLKYRKSVDVAVSCDGAVKVIPSHKIYYAEVDKHNIIYHTDEGRFSTRGALNETEKKLAPENFVRCNSCYLVNLRYVSEVRGDNVKVGADVLKISRAKKKEFMNTLASYLGRGGGTDV